MSAPLPGPRLPAAVQTMLYWATPRRTVRRWRARYGDVVGATIHPMGKVVFLCRAGDIKELMRADTAKFRAGAANAALGGASSSFSVLIADGPRRRRSRAATAVRPTASTPSRGVTPAAAGSDQRAPRRSRAGQADRRTRAARGRTRRGRRTVVGPGDRGPADHLAGRRVRDD